MAKTVRLKNRTTSRPTGLLLGLLASASIFLLFYNLGGAPLGKAESRIAEVVREMAIKGDLLHPTCLFIPYVTKPLLPYWLAIGTSKVTGVIDEFTLRIPSALGAFAALVATFFLGGMISGLEAGLFSSAILLSCLGVLQWGRCASPDMLNMAAITVAIAWYWRWRQEPRFWAILVFGLLTAISGHMKGLVGVVIPLMAAGIDILYSRRFRLVMQPANLLVLAAGLGIYLVPFLLSSWSGSTHGYNWLSTAFRESITRAIKPFDHEGSPFMYVEFVPVWILPWAPLLLGMMFLLLRDIRRQSQQTRWLLICSGAIFVMFTLAGSRRSYYILPILPFCALVAGTSLSKNHLQNPHLRMVFGLQAWFFLLVAVCMIVFSAWGLLLEGLPFSHTFMTMVLVHGLVILVFSLAFLYWAKLSRPSLSHQSVLLVFIAILIIGGLTHLERPFFEQQATEKAFVHQVKQRLLKESNTIPLYFRLGVRTRARVSFYLGQRGPVRNFLHAPSLTKHLSPRKGWLIILAHEDKTELLNALNKLQRARIEEIFSERFHKWEGWPGRQEKEKEGKLLCLEITWKDG